MGRRFGDDVGESATPSFGDALWRIKEELGGFGLVFEVSQSVGSEWTLFRKSS